MPAKTSRPAAARAGTVGARRDAQKQPLCSGAMVVSPGLKLGGVIATCGLAKSECSCANHSRSSLRLWRGADATARCAQGSTQGGHASFQRNESTA